MNEIKMKDVLRLQDIKDEIKELVYEAQDLIPRDTIEFSRAKSYWLPHILMALDKDHDYLGGSMFTMQETVDDLNERRELMNEDD
jgi:hypothetical protein